MLLVIIKDGVILGNFESNGYSQEGPEQLTNIKGTAVLSRTHLGKFHNYTPDNFELHGFGRYSNTRKKNCYFTASSNQQLVGDFAVLHDVTIEWANEESIEFCDKSSEPSAPALTFVGQEAEAREQLKNMLKTFGVKQVLAMASDVLTDLVAGR